MKSLFLSLITIVAGITAFGQATYQTTGKGSGQWNDPVSWELVSNTQADSDHDGIPDANDNVKIQPGHYLIVSEDVSCANITMVDEGQFTELIVLENITLTINNDLIAASHSDAGELHMSVYGVLDINGKIEQQSDGKKTSKPNYEWYLGYEGVVRMKGSKIQP